MGIYTMDSLSLGTVTMYLFDTISSMPGIQGAKFFGLVLIDLNITFYKQHCVGKTSPSISKCS